MRKRNILILIIVLMAVGFAVVTTNLIINGSTTIGNNIDDYDVRFTNTTLDGVEDNSLIIESGKKIKYETKKLINIGETSELIYEITNNSSLYDASVSINCAAKDASSHLNLYTIDTTNTPEIINAKKSETGSIKITLINSVAENLREEFECTLNIEAMERTTIGEKEDYKDKVLNGADPKLNEGLIPITLSNDGIATYADVKEEWYNYENKEWANAITLTNSAKTYKVGEVISESDIESYFVWVPKYKYKLWNVNSTEENIGRHSIEIKFGLEDTTDIEGESCVTPMVSGESGNCNNGEYMTHPAFLSIDVNGLWIGKFETGYKGATTSNCTSAVIVPDSTKIIIKPNVYSWRNNTVSNMFIASYNYKRKMGSHMMKNTEWGAVSYLSNSIYGINTEIRINNNLNYLTGYAANTKDGAASKTDNQAYNTEVGYLGSTTGNITGIYDMSGGAFEYMSSYKSGNIGSSGFNTINNYDSKYFDIYNASSEMTTYTNRILGDATGEMGPFVLESRWHSSWYGDLSEFVNSDTPWFHRGGYLGTTTLSGQFHFERATGANADYLSFRIVLAN